jgi:hypothetical protein
MTKIHKIGMLLFLNYNPLMSKKSIYIDIGLFFMTRVYFKLKKVRKKMSKIFRVIREYIRYLRDCKIYC